MGLNMNRCRICHGIARNLIWLSVVACLIQLVTAVGIAEDTFPVLQIGTQAYTNVTVTTKAKNYIFILHAQGMTNIKIADLSPQLLEQLGYVVAKEKQTNTTVAVWANRQMAKIEGPQIKNIQLQLQHLLRGNGPYGFPSCPSITPKVVLAALGILLFCYLFFCYCCSLICEKVGAKPGGMIWLPFLQLFPLLRAASMSPWWFFAYFVPFLNIVAQVLWSVRIVRARAKSAWVALFLLLPVINVFAFLYLAFSTNSPEKEEKTVEIMTLEAA